MTHPTEQVPETELSIEIETGDVIITRSNSEIDNIYRVRGITDTGLVRVRERFNPEETEYGKAQFLEMLNKSHSIELTQSKDL